VDETVDGISAVWGLSIRLTTASIGLLTAPDAGLAASPLMPTNSPAFARAMVMVPTNAATLTFTFALEGDGQSDSFVFGINGTNLLTLDAEFMPQTAPVPSGPIDVTAWKGQTVEMFFGVVGGTSTNASVTVQQLHFNSLTPVDLQYAKSGNALALSWPVTAAGYQLESTPELGGAALWTPVTNAVGIVGFEQVFTNSLTATNQFFRLRQP
jgi:hypothetical protein